MDAVILAINTVGLLGYLFWLVKNPEFQLFHSRDGILYILPFLLFFFVYLYLCRGKFRDPDEAPDPFKDDDKPGPKPWQNQ